MPRKVFTAGGIEVQTPHRAVEVGSSYFDGSGLKPLADGHRKPVRIAIKLTLPIVCSDPVTENGTENFSDSLHTEVLSILRNTPAARGERQPEARILDHDETARRPVRF